MKKIAIIKCGDTYDFIKQKYGDFEDFIIKQASLDYEKYIIIDARNTKHFPSMEAINGIIITGSHSMVTDKNHWILNLCNWILDISKKNIPILGICFGHQLLCEAFDGKVGYNEKGVEKGTVYINLTEEGKSDKLFKVLPEKFLGHTTHYQTIISAPLNSKVLAKNDFENHHAISIGDNIWGVQFHPEFTKEIMIEYIRADEKELIKMGYNVNSLYAFAAEHEFGRLLLQRFVEIAFNEG